MYYYWFVRRDNTNLKLTLQMWICYGYIVCFTTLKLVEVMNSVTVNFSTYLFFFFCYPTQALSRSSAHTPCSSRATHKAMGKSSASRSGSYNFSLEKGSTSQSTQGILIPSLVPSVTNRKYIPAALSQCLACILF